MSEAANQLYAEGYAVVAIPELAQPIEYMPEDLQSKMIDNDFDWAASNRERILAEWQKRYDVKTEAEELTRAATAGAAQRRPLRSGLEE